MPGVPLTKASPIPPPGPIRVKYRIRSSCSTKDMWIAGQLLGLWNGSLRTAHTQYSSRLTDGSRSNGSNALTWSCSKKRCGAQRLIATTILANQHRRTWAVTKGSPRLTPGENRDLDDVPWGPRSVWRCWLDRNKPYQELTTIFTTKIGATHRN